MGHTEARRSVAAASRAGQAGPILIWLALFSITVMVVLVFMGVIIFSIAVSGFVFEPIAATGNGNYLSVMKEPVQDRCGRGNIAEQLSPVLQRSIRGHYRGFCLIPPHDDFKQVLL